MWKDIEFITQIIKNSINKTDILNKLGLKGLLAFGEEKQAVKEGKFLIHSGYQRAGPLVNIEFLNFLNHKTMSIYEFYV